MFQNNEMKRLKVEHNPFSKSQRNTNERKRKQKEEPVFKTIRKLEGIVIIDLIIDPDDRLHVEAGVRRLI